MSDSSENHSFHRSGGESDCESSAASSHESELPDTPKPRRNKKIQGWAWILRGEITTTLLHNDSASMDCDNDEEAKVQNTRSQTEAAFGATFEILFGKKQHPHVKYFVFFCNLVNILHAGPAAAATEIKIQIRGFLQMEKTLRQRRSKNYWSAAPSLLFFPENGSVAKAACMETMSTKLAGLRKVRQCQSRLGASSASATKAG
jgi:hypothetical protein